MKIIIRQATIEIITENENSDRVASQQEQIAYLEEQLKKANIYIDDLEKIKAIAAESLPDKIDTAINQQVNKTHCESLKGTKASTGTKKCSVCGNDYKPSGNAQLRCPDCKGHKKVKIIAEEIKQPVEFKKIVRSCATCKYENLCKTSRKCKQGSVEFFEIKN